MEANQSNTQMISRDHATKTRSMVFDTICRRWNMRQSLKGALFAAEHVCGCVPSVRSACAYRRCVGSGMSLLRDAYRRGLRAALSLILIKGVNTVIEPQGAGKSE